MVLSKKSLCWKNSLATDTFPTQQESIMLCDVDVSCILTCSRCHVMLTSLTLIHMVGAARCWPNVSNNAAWPAVSPEIWPQFPGHGAGNRAPISSKTPPTESVPNLGRVWGSEPATFRLQACVPPTRPKPGGQHGHTSSFATWPSPPVPARPNPKSKILTPNGPFGFRILDLGFWV